MGVQGHGGRGVGEGIPESGAGDERENRRGAKVEEGCRAAAVWIRKGGD